MTYFNNAIRTKRQLLVSLFQLMKSNTLFERIDRIPIEMRPKTNSPIRCCVHKDRAVIKYKVMALLAVLRCSRQIGFLLLSSRRIPK